MQAPYGRRSLHKLCFVLGVGLSGCATPSRRPDPPTVRIPKPPPPPLPAKVMEVVPPAASTRVRIALHPSFDPTCEYRAVAPSGAKQRDVTEVDLSSLHAEQEQLLRDCDALVSRVNANLASMLSEWRSALKALDSDLQYAWRRKATEAYGEILRNVLTRTQRAQYEKLKRKGKPSAESFRYLRITSTQKRQMVARYTEALQQSQKAWLLSEVFSTHIHRVADSLLCETERFPQRVDAVLAVHQEVVSAVKKADREFRDAERQLRWLTTCLEVEDDLKKQIQIRKQIADTRVDAKLRQVRLQRKRRGLASHNWRAEELARARQVAAVTHAKLSEAHKTHVSCLRLVSSLRGLWSDQCTLHYEKIRQLLLRGIASARQRERRVPPQHVREPEEVRRCQS